MRRANIEGGAKRKQPMENLKFKFVFLVDNSGSMDGGKMTLALNILVVLLETMKGMEYEPAVVRFGCEESQTTLKGFGDKLDNERGQFIIEAFDASEKTLAADAVRYVAESDELYSSECESNEYRFIVLITDGIWAQREKNVYVKYLSDADARLMVFTTHPHKKDFELYNMNVKRAKEILDSIAPGAWESIDADIDLSTQIKDIANKLDANLHDIINGLPECKTYRFNEFQV